MLKCHALTLLVASLLAGTILSDPVERRLNSARMTQASQYPKIRVLFDFTYLQGYSQNVQTYVSKTIFGTVKKRLEKLISMRVSKPILAFNTTICESISVPNVYRTSSTDADLIVFVVLYETTEPVTASARPCAFDKETQRANVGLININYSNLRWGRDQIDPVILTVLHELLHILVISPTLYGRYPNYPNSSAITTENYSVGNSTQKQRRVISTPGLLSFTRDYFNCPSMKGLPLEDEGTTGSAGSHWEKIILGNELMTSQKVSTPSLSMFTLYLMNDSGWYTVDFSQADDITWGKYMGCDFVYNPCSTKYKEFCTTEGKTGCSTDYGAKTICYKSQFSNDCLYNEYARNYACSNSYDFIYSSRFEVPGPESRCFEVKINNVQNSNCFKAVCKNSGVEIVIEGNTFTCEFTGQIIKYRELEVTCPNIQDFCNKTVNRKCPNDCNGKGVCTVVGECRCDYFYTGPSCEIEQDCHEGDESICSILKQIWTGTVGNRGEMLIASVALLLIGSVLIA